MDRRTSRGRCHGDRSSILITGISQSAHDARTRQSFDRPTLDDAALHGLTGDIVQAIEPHTEADSAALLTNLLAFFGNAVDCTPHVMADGNRHGTNLFVVQVGESSKSRKGTALARITSLFKAAEPQWLADRTVSGLSSGEGLINALRDNSGRVDDDGELIEDGVDDKRLLVIEEEFASTLKVVNRDGNTLSPVVRQAWDGKPMHVLTKANPLRATGAHVSVIGHITKDELSRSLSQTEMANGFANRFLWVSVARSKCLPFGGGEPEYGDAVDRLRRALELGALRVEPFTFDDDARTLWVSRYEDLSDGRQGLVGSIVGRAEAQVLRLALVYAVMDMSACIRAPHLKAALALWRYADESATYIFSALSADPIADRIVVALGHAGTHGLDKTAISDLFGRHAKAGPLRAAITRLSEQGLIDSWADNQGAGRPRTIYTLR
jgi:Protein of unknown function (DUF3987)